ncbi:MAG: peptidoglycan binding domain-containing protein [Phycisphaerales bacterium]
MSKQQLIEAIRQFNRSVTQEFLITFNEEALNQYLHHLKYRVEPRNPQNVWVRAGDTAAIVTRMH